MWTNRYGKSIPVSEMTDAHLLNAIRRLLLLMHSIEVENVCSNIEPQTIQEVFPNFEYLVKEAKKRKLNI